MSPARAAAFSKFKESAPVFAALGDETRLRLVARLSAGPESVERLRDGSRMTRQAITKHLVVLSRAGLVRDRRIGRRRVWTLEARRLAEARQCLDRISAQWDDALDRLKTLVEKGSD